MGTKVHLKYGDHGLDVDLPTDNVDEFNPRPMTPLGDPEAAFRQAVSSPTGQTRSLREQVSRTAKVAIVTPDRTRVFPPKVIEWLLQELSHVARDNFTLVTGTGSHSKDTPAHLVKMFGKDIPRDYRVISHDSRDPESLKNVGTTPSGKPLHLNAEYANADVKIAVGYIEPHFMAGYSGGYKGIVPGVADIDTIMEYHGPAIIDSPSSTLGKTRREPHEEFLRHCGKQCPPDFLVNFVLDDKRRLVRFDCGEVMQAHTAGCKFLEQHAMVPAKQHYKIMVTTNGGHPKDLNLYQAVKGMTAAAEVIEPNGLIVAAAECRDGFPDHGNFKDKLLSGMTPEQLRDDLFEERYPDSWEVLKLINILLRNRARIALLSSLPPELVMKAGLEPINDVGARVDQELNQIGRHERVGLIGSGFDAIPVLRTA